MNDSTSNIQTAAKPEWAKNASDRRRDRGEKPSRIGLIIFIVIVILVAGFIVFKSATAPAEDASNLVVSNEPVTNVKYIASQETAVIRPITLKQQIKVTGSLSPLNTAQLPALISAQIETVYARPGDKVKKGQLLVSMDTENLVIQKEQQLSNVEATQSQLALAESQLKRTQEMTEKGIATSSQLEQAVSTVQAQKATLQAQKSQIKATDYQLRNANIYAPFDGVISLRQSEPGQFVGTGSALMSLVDLSVMELMVNVSTSDSINIIPGMNVTLAVEGLTNKNLIGTVSRLSPITANGSRAIPVFITINNNEQTLRGGMFATGHITLKEKSNAIAIDEGALRFEGNKAYVLKIVDGITVSQPVELGALWGENQRREITSGLNAGDQIIVLPMQGLQVGDAVELIEG